MGRLEHEVEELILLRYRSKASFAQSIGISKNTLYTVLKKGFSHSTLQTILPIVDALDLNLEELARGHLTSNADLEISIPVPLYGDISAGVPLEAIPVYDTFPLPSQLHTRYPNAFMLRVKGNSMNLQFPEGYYVLVDPRNTIDIQGGVYAVSVGRENATLKHVYRLSNGLKLAPNSDDPTNHEIIIDFANPKVDQIRIIGLVVWSCPPTM